jgi:hypothetical protein
MDEASSMYSGEEKIYKLSLGKTKGYRPLGTHRCRHRITLKLILKKQAAKHGVD